MKLEELCIADLDEFVTKYTHRRNNRNSCPSVVIKAEKNSPLSYCASAYNRATISGHQYIILKLRTSLRNGCEKKYVAIEIQFSEWLKKQIKDLQYKTISETTQGGLGLV